MLGPFRPSPTPLPWQVDCAAKLRCKVGAGIPAINHSLSSWGMLATSRVRGHPVSPHTTVRPVPATAPLACRRSRYGI